MIGLFFFFFARTERGIWCLVPHRDGRMRGVGIGSIRETDRGLNEAMILQAVNGMWWVVGSRNIYARGVSAPAWLRQLGAPIITNLIPSLKIFPTNQVQILLHWCWNFWFWATKNSAVLAHNSDYRSRQRFSIQLAIYFSKRTGNIFLENQRSNVQKIKNHHFTLQPGRVLLWAFKLIEAIKKKKNYITL